MLLAHIVPGYFAGTALQLHRKSEWNGFQKYLLWGFAFGSTVAPDIDVIYNICFRGLFRHQTVWTHSIFVYMMFGGVWLMLRAFTRWTLFTTTIGLITVGGCSHLLLDYIAHGTPLFYPLSMIGFGMAPQRVVHGGVLAYLTDPIVLLEPILFSSAIIHWIYCHDMPLFRKRRLIIMTVGGTLICIMIFLLYLPSLQKAILPLLPR